SFSDADPNGTSTDYSATIKWGDGQTSAGTVTANGSGGFDVSGTNTYAEEGSNPITVSIADHAASATANSTANVADAALAASAKTVTPTEGNSFSGVVASFSDADPNGTSTDYSATIKWGDGQTSAGTVTANGSGGFDVSGTNTYAEEGNASITVTKIGSAAWRAGNSTANVADAALAASAKTVTPTEGNSFSGVVDSFSDADHNGTIIDYSATIKWGDGQTSVGTIVANGSGGFDVSGTNTYAEEGNASITVTITDHAASATANSTANVADSPLHASGVAV